MLSARVLLAAAFCLCGCFDLTLDSPCQKTADCPAGQVCTLERRCMVVVVDRGAPADLLADQQPGPDSAVTDATAGCGPDGTPCNDGDSKTDLDRCVKGVCKGYPRVLLAGGTLGGLRDYSGKSVYVPQGTTITVPPFDGKAGGNLTILAQAITVAGTISASGAGGGVLARTPGTPAAGPIAAAVEVCVVSRRTAPSLS